MIDTVCLQLIFQCLLHPKLFLMYQEILKKMKEHASKVSDILCSLRVICVFFIVLSWSVSHCLFEL